MTSFNENNDGASSWEDRSSTIDIIRNEEAEAISANQQGFLSVENSNPVSNVESDYRDVIEATVSESREAEGIPNASPCLIENLTATAHLLGASSDEHGNIDHKRKASSYEDKVNVGVENVIVEPSLVTTPKKRIRRNVPARISWEDRIASLKAYKEEHGDLNIPIRYKKNTSLGKFVHNTREQYKLFHNQCKPGYQKRCCLTTERIAVLNEIGFLWTTERSQKQNDDWASRLEQLKEYKAKHGHCLVPHGYDVDPSFAEWIHRQRTTYISMLKEEKPSSLVQSRMAKLEEIGFNFTVHSDKWMDHWNMLKQYKEKHGDCQVPTHYPENPKLGRWTHTQRHQRRLQLKGKKSCITDERIALLDQLGFSWEVRPAMEQPRATWQQRFDELREFHLVHGHFLIPLDIYPKLHRWSHEQRSRLQSVVVPDGPSVADSGLLGESPSSRRMGPDRIKALEEIGFTKDTTLLELPITVATSPLKSQLEDVVVEADSESAVVNESIATAI